MKKATNKNRSKALLDATAKNDIKPELTFYAVYGEHIIATDSFRLHSGINRGAPDGIYDPNDIGHYISHDDATYPPLEQLQGLKDTENNEKASLKELYQEIETASFKKIFKERTIEFRGYTYNQQYLLDAIEHMHQQGMGLLDEVNMSISEHGKLTLTSEEMDTVFAIVMPMNSL